MQSIDAPLPALKDVEPLLPFLAVFERPGFAALVPSPGVFPGAHLAPEVRAFMDVLYERGWVRAFDWMAWRDHARVLVEDEEALDRADLGDLVRLLTTHVRQDRFCEGHFADMLARGHIAAILRRLARLHAGEGNP